MDLDGGPSVKANLTGVDPSPEAVAPGLSVRLTTFSAGRDADGTEAVAFGFVPA